MAAREVLPGHPAFSYETIKTSKRVALGKPGAVRTVKIAIGLTDAAAVSAVVAAWVKAAGIRSQLL